MHKLSFVKKPVEPTGTFNGFLSAVINGQCGFSDYDGEYSFKSTQDLANPDLALRGHENTLYDGVPRLEDIDPTSPLAVSLTAAHRRQPKGKVGYTHHFIGLDYLSAISAQFAHWKREYDVIYQAASKAQAAQESDSFTVLDSETQIHYGSGDVEAFYAATGTINSGFISYPESKELDVDLIYNKVNSAIQAQLSILDDLGYREGEKSANEYIGISSFPKTGVSTAVITASSFDRLYRSPWAATLRNARSRDLYRERFMSRVDEAMRSKRTALAAPAADLIGIAEGDDIFYLPASLADEGWDAITAAVDARPALVDRYNSSNWLWTDQFYNKGELVSALLDGTISPFAPRLRVGVSMPVIYNDGVDDYVRFGPEVIGTGALSTISPWQTSGVINLITGSIPARVGGDQLLEGSSADSLPGGLLYLGNCGEATAVQWISILRSLNLFCPQELKELLSLTGRAKRTLPKGSATLSSFDALIGQAISNGMTDGYINAPMLAFNVTRLTRAEQDGPAVAGNQRDSQGNFASVSSYLLSNVNGWDRLDNSEGRYLVSPFGKQLDLSGPTSSRFTGEWDAGRYASWSPAPLSESIALGSGTVEENIASKLLGMPGAMVDGVFSPRYAPDPYNRMTTATFGWDSILTGISSSADADNMRGLLTYGDVASGAVPGYERGLQWESWHPTRGFMRGLAAYFAADGYNSVATRPANLDEVDENVIVDTTGVFTYGVTSFVNSVSKAIYDPVYKNYGNANDAELSGFGNTTTLGRSLFTWLWDPTRADIVGDSWHRWAGHHHEGVLPHPYMPHPVAVTTAAATLDQLLVGESAGDRPNCVTVMCGGEVTNGFEVVANAGMKVPAFQPRSTMTYTDKEWSSEGDTAHRSVVMGRSTSWEGMVGASVSDSYHTTLATVPTVHPLDYALTGYSLGEEYVLIPKFDVIFPVTNGCDSKKMFNDHLTTCGPSRAVGRHAYTTVSLPTDGVSLDVETTIDTPSGPVAGSGVNWVSKVEGELVIPQGAYNGGLGRAVENSLVPVIAIDGRGFLFEGDILTGNMLSHKSWIESVSSDDNSAMFNSFTNFWPPIEESTSNNSKEFYRYEQVESPQTLPNFITQGFSPAWYSQNSVRIVHQDTGVANDWFRKGADLHPKHARLRKKALVNPWVKSPDTPGMYHLRYETDTLDSLYDTYVKAIIARGKTFQKGLENSLFLEIQQAN